MSVAPLEETIYGYKRPGNSQFVIVAPHAGGDDRKTGVLARQIAKRLDASVVVNKKYFKATNQKAQDNPEFIEDFNKLSWSNKHSHYIWRRKKPAMKAFFQDIISYSKLAKKQSLENKAIVVYIHGIRDESIGLDLGVGLRAKKDSNRFHGSSRSDYYSTGVPTIRIRYIKDLKNSLMKRLPAPWQLSIGGRFPAWSKRAAIQFHKHRGRDDYALQLEINHLLKNNKEKRIFITRLISKSLKEVF